jgi:GNAT superfamily N-acetyltransferase
MLRDQLFDDPELTRYSLDEQLSNPLRVFTSVAEIDGVIEGFATAMPFSLPGTGQIDPSNMLLQHLAVNKDHWRRGLGRLLVEHLEQRINPHRQNVIAAHVLLRRPTSIVEPAGK